MYLASQCDPTGLWHPQYIEPAQRLLPYCRLAHIGVSPAIALKHFWSSCSAFSLNYATLVGKEGAIFRKACHENGKELYVWTVNDRQQMIQAIKWGASVVLTDKTADYLNVRGEASSEFLLPFFFLLSTFFFLLPSLFPSCFPP